MENNQTKVCTKCKIEQEVSCFCKNKGTKDGLRYECKSCRKKYNKKNKDKIQKYQSEYNKKNKEKISKRLAQHYQENKDKISKRVAGYYQGNKQYYKKYQSEYYKTPKGKAVNKNNAHKRRTIEKQGNLTTKQLLELQKNAKVCYWCNCSLKKVKVHIDHYEPLSKGGEHTLTNLVVSCYKCNQTKSAKDPLAFAQSLGKLL